jgi:hypothetical protein
MREHESFFRDLPAYGHASAAPKPGTAAVNSAAWSLATPSISRVRRRSRVGASHFCEERRSDPLPHDPVEPRTTFYDWLYINAIYPHREWLVRLNRYAGFTDIEFNPERSVNCQARSCALFVSLMAKGLLDTAVESPPAFRAMITEHRYRPRRRTKV